MSKAWDKLWEDLGVRVDTSLTDEEILAACVAYRDEMGRLPSAGSGDASKWVKFRITWQGIAVRLEGGLPKFLRHHGLTQDRKLTEESVLEACLAYREKLGKNPSSASGDASEWFGFPLSWTTIDNRVQSLSQFLLKHGLRHDTSLTDEEILRACIAYRDETGNLPTSASGVDATKWFGFPISWSAINIRVGSLSQFLIKHGIRDNTSLEDSHILQACVRYYKETGRYPARGSGDATKWIGFDFTWAGVDRRVGGIRKFLIKQKTLHDTTLSEPQIIEAIQRFHSEMGRMPSAKQGDASKWFGFKIGWHLIDKRVGSLSKFLVKHGLTEKRVLTDDMVLKACVDYQQETGKRPTVESGDASKWIGFPIQWSGVNSRIGSLSKFLKKHGLKP